MYTSEFWFGGVVKSVANRAIGCCQNDVNGLTEVTGSNQPHGTDTSQRCPQFFYLTKVKPCGTIARKT